MMEENRLTKEYFDTRQKYIVRLHANKFMAEGEIKNVNDIVNILASMNDIYKIEVFRIKENYNIRTNLATKILEQETLPLWVADEISNVRKIQKATGKAKLEPEVTEKNINNPAIQTGTHTQYSVALRTNMYSAPRRVPVAKIVMWRELTDKDIVVNKNMKQIYPTVTAKVPEVLSRLLENVR